MAGISWMYFWLAVLVIAVILEMITVGLTSIWMAGGALVALVASALSAPVWLQVILFFGVTFILIIFTRPWAMKYLNARRSATNNTDEPIGKEVRVIEEVNNRLETGKVMHRGIEWTARAADPNEVIAVDEFARVIALQGVKLLVKRVEPAETPVPGVPAGGEAALEGAYESSAAEQ